jgi:bifunctional non-homologous end joining protein LigD
MKAELAVEINHTRYPIKYLQNPDFGISQKIDGHRILLQKMGSGHVEMLNRNGKPYTHQKLLPRLIETFPFDRMPGGWTFDGELVDNVYHVFDLPFAGAIGIHEGTPYRDRYLWLQNFMNLGIGDNPYVKLVPFIYETDIDKDRFFIKCLNNQAEGVMFRRLDAPYTAGKRNPRLLKFKFVKTANVWISAINIGGKDNCELSVYRDLEPFPVGKASTIGKGLVQIGDVFEVRYLYLGPGNRLVQPRLMRCRIDADKQDCLFDLLEPTDKTVIQL